jgi:hypothetical protein
MISFWQPNRLGERLCVILVYSMCKTYPHDNVPVSRVLDSVHNHQHFLLTWPQDWYRTSSRISTIAIILRPNWFLFLFSHVTKLKLKHLLANCSQHKIKFTYNNSYKIGVNEMMMTNIKTMLLKIGSVFRLRV